MRLLERKGAMFRSWGKPPASGEVWETPYNRHGHGAEVGTQGRNGRNERRKRVACRGQARFLVRSFARLVMSIIMVTLPGVGEHHNLHDKAQESRNP
jgi:hypothetical protein